MVEIQQQSTSVILKNRDKDLSKINTSGRNQTNVVLTVLCSLFCSADCELYAMTDRGIMFSDEDLALQLFLEDMRDELLAKYGWVTQASLEHVSLCDICWLSLGKASKKELSKEQQDRKRHQGAENIDPDRKKKESLVDPSFEYIDPTPDVYAMFVQFNNRFFWGTLTSVEVKWSRRMTSCAGVCSYEGRGGLCSIRLSEPLLKLRPRKDLVETLLHEMIHAYLFVTNNDRDRDGHGPEFHRHMYRINGEAGTNITVYHNFYNEVKLYQQHWWRCNGLCQKWRPYYGMVKRAMNRPPGPSDNWWADHQAKCGGKFIKVREPTDYTSKKKTENILKGDNSSNKIVDIRDFFGKKVPSANTSVNNSKQMQSDKKVTEGKESPGKNASSNVVKVTSNLITNNNKPSTKYPSGSNNNYMKGVLANKGGGTIMITQKGNKQLLKNNGTKTDSEHCNNNSATVKPFSGNGYTLGTSGTQQKNSGEKPWLSFLDNIEADLKGKKLIPASATKKSSSFMENKTTNNVAVHTPPKKQKTDLSKGSANDKFRIQTNDGFKKESSSENDSVCIMVNCPVCGIVMEESIINSHLDTCVQCDNAETVSEETVNCPICMKHIPENNITEHVDKCLNTESETASNSKVEQEMIQCPMCTKKLRKCLLEQHLESCIQCISKDDAFFTEEGDNCNSKSDQNIGNSADDLQQCPICMKLVKQSDMNIHLVGCLSTDNFNDATTDFI